MRTLRWISRIVPADARRDWLREWEGERAHGRARRTSGLGRASSVALALSAIEDATRTRLRRAHPGPILRDVVFGIRLLRRSPGFTAVAAITLALGVGANTAVFSVVNALLLRPLDYERPEDLVALTSVVDGRVVGPISYLDFLDYEERVESLDAIAYGMWWSPVLRLDEPVRLAAVGVTHDYFELFGREPHLGRYLQADDDPLGAAGVVVLSHGLWQQQFGSDPDIVGSSVVLDDAPHTVVGVAEPDFADPLLELALWRNPPAYLGQAGRGQLWIQGWARVADGVSLAAAGQEIAAASAALAQEHSDTNDGRTVRLIQLRERLVGEAGSAALVLLGAVVLVLLIACANVANLLLSRGASRDRELAVRTAMGAGRGRLMRQLITESLLLAMLGGGVGVWLGWLLLQALRSVEIPGLPTWVDPALDGSVLLFTLFATFATGILFGLAPLRQAARSDVDAVLRETARGASGGVRSGRTRAALATAELALATVLLIGAGLMIRSFVNLAAVETGLQPEGVLTLSVNTNRFGVAPEVQTAYFAELRERLAAVPGVESIGHANFLPLTGASAPYEFTLEDRPPPNPAELPAAEAKVVSAGYLETLGYRLLAGRLPNATDDWEAPPIAVVNQSFVDLYFSDGRALGVGLRIHEARHEIVGVVADTRQLGPAAPPSSEIYTVFDQQPTPYWMRPNATFVLRTAGDPMALADAARAAIWEIDDTVAVDEIGPMRRYLDAYHAAPRVQMLLLSGFAGLATLLAAIGVAGVVSYGVATRVHEIGIRRALGAGHGDVVGLVLRDVGRMTVAGVLLGLGGAWALTRLMVGLLYAVDPLDPATFVAVAATLGGLTLLAAWWPARRAGRIDPAIALRDE